MENKVYRRFLKYSYESGVLVWAAGSTAYGATFSWCKEGGTSKNARPMMVFESDLPFLTDFEKNIPEFFSAVWLDESGSPKLVRCEKLD